MLAFILFDQNQFNYLDFVAKLTGYKPYLLNCLSKTKIPRVPEDGHTFALLL